MSGLPRDTETQILRHSDYTDYTDVTDYTAHPDYTDYTDYTEAFFLRLTAEAAVFFAHLASTTQTIGFSGDAEVCSSTILGFIKCQ
jgi:hypothetical protein